MLGSMLAGHDERPGEIVEEDGEQYKLFVGMSSDTAMNKHHGGVQLIDLLKAKQGADGGKGSQVNDTIQKYTWWC